MNRPFVLADPEGLRQDVGYALRSFRRSPTFTATVIGTIALGLGVNAALFTMFNAYALRPVPVRDPYSLYEFTWREQSGRFHVFSRSEYEQLRRDTQIFSAVYAAHKQLVVRIDGRPAYGMFVSDEYFPVLGIDAALGRTLTADDGRPGQEAVVVLGDSYWRAHFAADPNVVGKIIVVGGIPSEVVGVLHRGFGGLDLVPHDFWAPLGLAPRLDPGTRGVQIVGRLPAETTVASAEAALTAWSRNATHDRRTDEQAVAAILESKATLMPRSPMILVLFGPILAAFAVVMLIACANVANMMLARAVGRQREIAIRLSLGAGRARVVRQMLTESLLLALPAAAVALLISHWAVDAGVRLLMAAAPPDYAEHLRLAPFAPDVRVFLFMVCAGAASAVLFGLAPALAATRISLTFSARADAPQARPRNSLVIVQITAAVCLLTCAALLVRASGRLANVDTGLRTRDVIEIAIREPARAPVLQALDRLAADRIGAVSSVPFDAEPPRVPIAAGSGTPLSAAVRFATPEFFDVLDVRLINGRPFTGQEAAARAPVAIVSETAARRLSAGGNQMATAFRLAADVGLASGRVFQAGTDIEVIGIARDIAIAGVETESDKTAIYFPASVRDAGMAFLVRVRGNVEVERRRLDESLTAAHPGAVERIHALHALAVGRVFPLRLLYWVSGLLGALALILTISGLYGLLTFVVTQRTREIGIRMALGASPQGVLGLMLHQSLRLALGGVAIGLALALAAAQLLGVKLLAMVRPIDAPAYLVSTVIVLAACLAAACGPALRAARVNPVAALRHE